MITELEQKIVELLPSLSEEAKNEAVVFRKELCCILNLLIIKTKKRSKKACVVLPFSFREKKRLAYIKLIVF